MPSLEKRPKSPEDLEFLYRLYASTRAEELAMVPWSTEEKEKFLRFQFEAQTKFYAEQFHRAQFDVLILRGRPVGRLYIDRRSDEIRLVDIALLPDVRGQGFGQELLQEILDEGQDRNLPVRIHVEHNNRAMRLYLRLGFEKIEEQGVYHLMEWKPSTK